MLLLMLYLFDKYLHSAVLPALKKFFPKTVIFFKWDGASSHTASAGDKSTNPVYANKVQLLKIIFEEAKIFASRVGGSAAERLSFAHYQLKVSIKGVFTTIDIRPQFHNMLGKKAGVNIPSVPEFRAAVLDWIAEKNPGRLMSSVESWGQTYRYKASDDATLYPIIFIQSVPKHPFFSNIENLFKDIKHDLADNFNADEKMTPELLSRRIARAFVATGWARASDNSGAACPPCSRSVRGIRSCDKACTDMSERYKGQVIGELTLTADDAALVESWSASRYTRYYTHLVKNRRLPLRRPSDAEPEPDIPEEEETIDLANDDEAGVDKEPASDAESA